MYEDVFIAGTGGQGILLIGNLIAEAAMHEGREVTFLPSYGVEMRGGNANCTVIISDREIGSPAITRPRTMIVMSKKALALYQDKVMPQGLLIVNSSLVPEADLTRNDLEIIALPFNELAAEMGDKRLANMLALGVWAAKTKAINLETLETAMEHSLSERSRKFIPMNMEAIRKGAELVNHGPAE